MIFLFNLSLFIVLYTYIGYPLALAVLVVLFPAKVKKQESTPFVTIVLSAYNEEKVIREKIDNLLSLDYPREKMEIILGSDGSTDETYRIIKSLADDKLVRYAVSFHRMGKPAMLNKMLRDARGEIYVFVDARQKIDKNALKELVKPFADPDIGAVSGELVMVDQETGSGKGMGLYWNYEKILRMLESRIGSMLGATGAIYAVRKDVFRYFPEDVILDDVYAPLNAVVAGKRAVYEPLAKAYDAVSETTHKEFVRKVRTLAGNFQIFGLLQEAFNPAKSSVWAQMISHKLLRLFVPYFLIILLFLNSFLLGEGGFYVLAFILQICFYALAYLGSLLEKAGVKGVLRFLCVPYEFCVLNFAAIVALKLALSGKLENKWEKTV